MFVGGFACLLLPCMYACLYFACIILLCFNPPPPTHTHLRPLRFPLPPPRSCLYYRVCVFTTHMFARAGSAVDFLPSFLAVPCRS